MIALALVILASDPLLSLDEALRQAVAHQPLLESYHERTLARRASLTQARAIEFPQVAAFGELFAATSNNAATSYITPPDLVRVGTRPKDLAADSPGTVFGSSLMGIGAHYDVLDFGYTGGTVGAAEAIVQVAEATEQQALEDALLHVSEAYFRAVAAEQELAIANDTLERTKTHYELAQAAVKSGLKPPIDLARAEAELAAGKLGVIRSSNAVSVTRSALETAIGWAPANPYSLASPEEDGSSVPEEAQAITTALATRRDLAAAAAQEHQAQELGVAAASGHWPRLTATTSASWRGFAAVPDVFNWDVGLVLSFPLFAGFNVMGQQEEAAALEGDARARSRELRERISFQLRQSRTNLLSAREAIQASRAQADAARVNLSLAEGRYKQGLGNIVELADAQAQFESAKLGLVQSQLGAAISRAQLNYAMGTLAVPQ